jgi:hypothetical protein
MEVPDIDPPRSPNFDPRPRLEMPFGAKVCPVPDPVGALGIHGDHLIKIFTKYSSRFETMSSRVNKFGEPFISDLTKKKKY